MIIGLWYYYRAKQRGERYLWIFLIRLLNLN